MRNPLFRPSTRYHIAVREKACEERGRNLELSVEPSVPPVHTVPHGGQMETCEERGGV